MWIQIDLPPEINKLLRIYAVQNELGSREKSVIFILDNFFKEYLNEK